MRKLSNIYCAFGIFTLMCFVSAAQQRKDTVLLNEVKVTDYRSKSTSENFSQVESDSATKSNFSNSFMPQLLLQQNACFVKSYGPANIASLSIRGSSAQQTAVVWNGMNINNPMLGQADVSLLPVGFFNSISLQKGALSGYWGSGAMASVLNLQSATQNNSGLVFKASSSYSSLQNNTNWVSVNFSPGKISSATRVLLDASKNQYNYFVNDSTVVKQTHAETKQIAVMQDLGYSLNADQQIGLHVWLQQSQRQIPYTLSEIKQDASQEDKIFRAMLDWKLNQVNFSMSAKTAFFNEAINYNNNTYSIFSTNSFKTFMADVETQIYLPQKFILTAGSTNSLSQGVCNDYAKQQQISRAAVYENISRKAERLTSSIYGRQEVFNLNVFVPTFGFTNQLTIVKCLNWKINAGTVYRYPTLNDLYWNPGGNLNLKPEHGYSAETALQLNKHVKEFGFLFTGTIFTRNIQNCIVWLPGKNGVWTPQNIQQVWSRGGETNTEISYMGKKVRSTLNLITNYVLSSKTKTSMQNDESLNRQMTYVPMYSGSTILTFEYKNWSLRTACTYMGYRYLTNDGYSYLKPYHVADVRLAKTFFIKQTLLNVYMEANNLLNENYQSVNMYAMPLRNFKAGIILQYTKPKIKNK